MQNERPAKCSLNLPLPELVNEDREIAEAYTEIPVVVKSVLGPSIASTCIKRLLTE